MASASSGEIELRRQCMKNIFKFLALSLFLIFYLSCTQKQSNESKIWESGDIIHISGEAGGKPPCASI